MNVQTPMPEYTDLLIDTLERLKYWRKEIEKAIARGHGLVTFTDVVRSIVQGKRVFLDNGNSFAIVESVTHPQGLEVLIWMAGGKQEALYELEKEVMFFAQQIKARRLILYGREGFKRRIPSHGWVDTGQTMFIKEVQS
jgi:hypothetical protein